MVKPVVEISYHPVCQDTDMPTKKMVTQWVTDSFRQALIHGPIAEVQPRKLIVSMHCIDEVESARLNRHFRHKSGPTNVLAFPYHETDSNQVWGDILLCTPLVKQEAVQQGKPLQQHWARLIIHGTLHLCGFDHDNDETALEMETVEMDILTKLGFNIDYEQ